MAESMELDSVESLAEYCKEAELSLDALELAFYEHPELITERYDDESWLLMVCLNPTVTLEIVAFLVPWDPDAVSYQGTVCLPIHGACLNQNAGLDIIEYLVYLYPESLMVRSAHSSSLPIHMLFYRFVEQKELLPPEELEQARRQGRSIYKRWDHERTPIPLDILEFFVAQSPQALRHIDGGEPSGNLPLHQLCCHEYVTLEALTLLVEEAPDTLLIRAGLAWASETALVGLLSNSANSVREGSELVFCVRYLVQRDPRVLQILGDSMLPPLQVACKNLHGDVSTQVVRFLLEMDPECIYRRGRDGVLPLHVACMNENCSPEAIRYLVEAFPGAVTSTNSYGLKPVRLAAPSHNQATLQLLVEQDMVDVAQERETDGSTLLHSVAVNSNSESLRYVYSLNENAIWERDGDGNLPFHRACRASSIVGMKFLSEKYAAAVKETNDAGELPMHVVAKGFGPQHESLDFLFEKSAEAIKATDNDGRLPFHSACAREYVRIKVLQTLAQLYPEAAMAADGEGNLPLHLVAKADRLDCDSLSFVLGLFPGGAMCKNAAGELPLHLALHRGKLTTDLLAEIVDAYPEAINVEHDTLGLPLNCAVEGTSNDNIMLDLYERQYSHLPSCNLPFHVILQDRRLGATSKTLIGNWFFRHYGGDVRRDRDWQGRAPLHLAVATKLDSRPTYLFSEDSSTLLDSLINADPDAVRLADNHGAVPLHYAFRHGDPNDVSQTLLQLYPGAVSVADVQGLLPIHVACRKGAPVDVVREMLEIDPTLCDEPDDEGELPLHKACRAGDADLISLLTEFQPMSVRVPNNDGVLPVFLLGQASRKQRRLDESTDHLGAIWTLMTNFPEAILPGIVEEELGIPEQSSPQRVEPKPWTAKEEGDEAERKQRESMLNVILIAVFAAVHWIAGQLG